MWAPTIGARAAPHAGGPHSVDSPIDRRPPPADGSLQPAHGGRVLEVFEPATGAVYAHCADSGTRDVDAAVQAAQRAFPAWSALPAETRAGFLQRIANIIQSRFDEFAEGLARHVDAGIERVARLAPGLDPALEHAHVAIALRLRARGGALGHPVAVIA